MCPIRHTVVSRNSVHKRGPDGVQPGLGSVVAAILLVLCAGTSLYGQPMRPDGRPNDASASRLRLLRGAMGRPQSSGPGQAQTITFPQPVEPAYASTSVTLGAAASSGLPVAYTVVSGPATINGTDGSTLTYTGAGTVVVEADQAGNGTYGAAPAVQDTVTVTVLTEPVGTPSAVVTASVSFATAGTLGSLAVLTLGAPNLDFNVAPGGSCALAAIYAAGQSCTVDFIFTPTRPGLRYGGIVLTGSDGATLANGYVYGAGTGPQLIFNPGTQSAVGSGLDAASGVAVDGHGDVFATALGGQAVSEIPAGGGPQIPLGSFTDAEDIAVDGSGNLFVISGRDTVSEIYAVNGTVPAAPMIRTIASGPANGLDALNGIKVDQNGDVFLANSFLSSGGAAVFEIVAVGGSIPANPTIRTLGSGFGGPTGVAVDPAGDVYVSDETNNAVYEILAVNGSIPATNPNTHQVGSGFISPSNVSLDSSGNVYVADYGNQAVKEILAVNGSIPATDPTIKTLGSGFITPEGLVIDGSGNVFVADSSLSSIAKLDYADPPTLSFAATAVGSTSSDSPQTVTLINDGNSTLNFTAPGSGLNPAISSGFTLGNSSTCPEISSSTSVGASLGTGSACTDVVSFTPAAGGADRGTLVTSDNALNVAGAAQTVVLNGTGIAVTDTVNLTATPNPVFLLNPVTLSAAVASSVGTPSGMVSFSEAGNVVGTAVLSNGVANLVLSDLAVGSHSITASYNSGSGDVVSTPAVVMVEDFSVSFNQPTLTIAHGGTATYSLVVSPIGGSVFPAGINFAVSGEPDTSSVTLNPQTAIAGNGSTTFTLTMKTPDYPVGPFSENRQSAKTDVMMAVSGLLLLCGRRRGGLRRQMRWIGCVVLLIAASTTFSGCGSGWGKQTFTVVVTGSSGPLSHTASSTLISQ